jgi:aryl-alcohol dehydrogenase-like predicted oxidoreductase
MAAAAKMDTGVVVRGGGSRGEPGRREGRYWDVWERAGLDELLQGMSRMAFTLRFTCANPDMATAVVATTSVDHLCENVSAVQEGPLPPDVVAEAKRRLAAVAPAAARNFVT